MKTTAKHTEMPQAVQAKANKQAPVNAVLQSYRDKTAQRESAEEEELLQGKFEAVQKMELEEEEPIQGKFETMQLQSPEEEELLQGKLDTAQLKSTEEEELLQGKFSTARLQAVGEAPLQKMENNTGLPDNLKSGVEHLSGYRMDDVKVHYNSAQPATLQAHAYARGTDIHIAPGQEKHLPHEAWHVVQQKQGRVKPTMQMKGAVPVNDDAGLEKEADVMGAKAAQLSNTTIRHLITSKTFHPSANRVQRKVVQLASVRLLEIYEDFRTVIDDMKMVFDEVDEDTVEKAREYLTMVHYYLDQVTELHETDEEGIAKQSKLLTVLSHWEGILEQLAGVPSSVSSCLRKVILADDWNNHDLVRTIGLHSWHEVEDAWHSLAANAIMREKMNKFVLVRLQGKPFHEPTSESEVPSYEAWPEITMGEQAGPKWGTETEGGRVWVSLKKRFRYTAKGATSDDVQKLIKLTEMLTYFKRTPLVTTPYGNLAIDNVFSEREGLLNGLKRPLPLEIASRAMDGGINVESPKAEIQKRENRKKETWPTVTPTEGRLVAVIGTAHEALGKFNLYFNTFQADNIPLKQAPQHVTVSGAPEDIIKMAEELLSTSKKFKKGTAAKSALSMMPKTALELLRHPSLSPKASLMLERMAHQIRETLRPQLPHTTIFADEHLNAIVIPKTGVPREIGGFSLTTPMTNAYPLIKLTASEPGVMTVLRERR
jgi:Domain of unknown function (DUF4157)